jgi:hypothetical protein
VFAARHGDKWSAVSVIATAEAIDLEVQPKASHALRVIDFEPHPLGASTLYWIATAEETRETTTGEADRDGSAHGTVCAVDPDTCFESAVLAAWSYSWPVDETDKCTVAAIEIYKAMLSPRELSVVLTGGQPSTGASARFTFDLAAPAPVPPAAPPLVPPDGGSGSAATAATPPADKGDDEEDDVRFQDSVECVEIVTKIVACQKDASFVSALDQGADAATKKLNATLRKQIASEWPKPSFACDTYFKWAFEHVGFLKDPDVLIEDGVLDTCATLGTAIREAGGLPGGEVAN